MLQADELPRFHEALKLESSESSRDAILMLLYTGARKMNVLSMHWNDIDFDRQLWVIPETKNGESHVVALTPEALVVLNRCRKKRYSVYVFPGTGSKGHLENLKKVWQRLLDRAGIDDLWIHDLRRTVGSYMANLGANQAQIQMQLGHKDPQSAKAYIHPDIEFVRPFTARVSRALSPVE